MESNMDKYELKYYQELHHLCLKSAFMQYLDLLGCKNSLLYLKVGNEIKIKVEDEKTCVYKHFQLMPFYDMIKIRSGKGLNFESVFKLNLNELPLVVLCDVYYMPFRQEYRKHHGTHAIILYEYNKKNAMVGVIDWYEPHFFKGYISLEDYKKSRESSNQFDKNIFSGYPVENYWYKLNDELDLLSIRDNYDRNVYEMFKSEKVDSNKIYRGKDAIFEINCKFKNMYCASEQDVKKSMSYYHNEFFVFYRTMLFGSLYYKEVYETLQYISALEYMNFCKNNAEILGKCNIIFMRGSLRPTKKYIDEIITLFQKLEDNYMKSGEAK